MTLSARLLAGLLALVLACPAAMPQEKAPAPPVKPPWELVDEAASAVLEAWKAKDEARLKDLAAKDEPDPWIVADLLCAKGEDGAAEAFAKAAPRPDKEALPGYVASRRGKADDADARRALAAMNAALMAKDWKGALEAIGPGDAGPPADVLGIRRAYGRAMALDGLRRTEEKGVALLLAGEAAERLGWRRRAVDALWRAGLTAWDRGDYRMALEAWERLLPLCELRGDDAGVMQAIGNLGNAYSHLGQQAKALEYAERAARLAAKLGDPGLLCRANLNLGVCHTRSGNRAKAIEVLERVLRMADEIGDRESAATALLNLGTTHDALGNYAKALDHHGRALRLAQEAGDRGTVAGCLIAIGGVHQAMGNHAKALDHLERGLGEARATGRRDFEAAAINCLGILHDSIGDHTRALEYRERDLKLEEALGRPSGVAGALINLGSTYGSMGNIPKELEYYERGLRAAEESGDREWAANAVHNIGSIHSRSGNVSKGLEFHERSLRMAEALGSRESVVSSLVVIGSDHVHLGDYAKAIPILERAVREAEELGGPRWMAKALWKLAEVRTAAGDGARALPEARRAVLLLKDVVGGLGDEQGATAREQFKGLFGVGLAAAAWLQDVPEAAFFLESGRAATLLESLDARDTLRRAALPEVLRLAEAEARSGETRARAAYAAARDGVDPEATRVRLQELEAAQARVREVGERIQREAKREAHLWYPVAAPVEDIQDLLGEGEALVLYGLAPKDSAAWALVLGRSEARLVGLGRSSAIVAACEALDASRPDEDPAPALERLRKLLVAPLALPEGTKRLLVSPEGPISYVPFAALVGDLEVAYEMSGTTYGVLLRDGGRRGEKTLALGDPDYGASYSKGSLDIYAPVAKVTPGSLRGARLVPLPWTREEAKAIGDVTLLGREASEPGLRAALAGEKRWHAVHLACHGLVDPDRPTLSSLALTPQGEDDGFLTALEVLRMEIPADLVVLSACETGKGRIVGGEGIVGLTRAFTYAGSPRVICSLWKVDDEATQALMTRFYELWNPKEGKGLGAAAALKQAQAFVASQEKWKHPRYWAAWVLWGLPE